MDVRSERSERGRSRGGGPIDSLGGGGEVTDLAPFSLSFCILLFLVLKSVSGDTHHVAPRVNRILRRRIRTSRLSSALGIVELTDSLQAYVAPFKPSSLRSVIKFTSFDD